MSPIIVDAKDAQKWQAAFDKIGKKLTIYDAIFAAETRREAENLAAAVERATGCSGIARIGETPDLPLRTDGVPCAYVVFTTSEILARSPELLARVRASVPHPRFVRLTRAGERLRAFALHQLADAAERLLEVVRRIKGRASR